MPIAVGPSLLVPELVVSSPFSVLSLTSCFLMGSPSVSEKKRKQQPITLKTKRKADRPETPVTVSSDGY